MNIRRMLRGGAHGTLALALLPAMEAAAQTANSSDVSGTIITTSDVVSGLFGNPGPVQTMFCPAATGVRNVALALADELERGDFWVARPNPGNVLLNERARASLRELLTAGPGRSAAARDLQATLTPAGNESRMARRAARELTSAMEGLVSAAAMMDPHHAGHVTPTRLARAVAGFNTFVNQSSEEYLAHPPDEFLAVQAVLARLVIAALENEGRPEVCGVLPPPPPPSEPPPPPPVVERLTSVCLMVDDELREVPTIVLPATGDSLVVVAGERKALSDAHPPSVYGPGAELAASDAPVELEGRRYLKFGLPRAVGPGCVVQPYERQELVRQVDG